MLLKMTMPYSVGITKEIVVEPFAEGLGMHRVSIVEHGSVLQSINISLDELQTILDFIKFQYYHHSNAAICEHKDDRSKK